MMRALCGWIHGRICIPRCSQTQTPEKKLSCIFHRFLGSSDGFSARAEREGDQERWKEEDEEGRKHSSSKVHGRIACICEGNQQLKNFSLVHHRFFCSNILARTVEELVAEDREEGAVEEEEAREDEDEEEREGIPNRELLQEAHNTADSDNISARTKHKAEEGTRDDEGKGKREEEREEEEEKVEEEAEQGDVMSKRDLLLQEGFSESQINKILSAEPRSDKLALLLDLLRNRGITGTVAGNFLASNLSFINSNLNSFRLKLELLEESGFTRELIRKTILLKSGSLSMCSSPQNLQKHVSFLKGLGLDPPGICLTMARLPEFFKLSIEKNVAPRCELLYSKGMSKESIAHILRSHPRVFSGSLEPGLLKRLELLEYFGLELKTKGGVRALGLWSKYAPKRLMLKFEYMKTLGFSHDQAVLMVRRQPNVLCMREDAMSKKITYVSKTLGRNIEELLSCPGYMTSSLEKRLIPRFSHINKLQKEGLLVKHVPLCSIVTTSDEAFAKRFKK